MKRDLKYFQKVSCQTPAFVPSLLVSEEQAEDVFLSGHPILFGCNSGSLEQCSRWTGYKGKLHVFPSGHKSYYVSPRALSRVCAQALEHV